MVGRAPLINKMNKQSPENYFRYLQNQATLARQQLDSPLEIDYRLLNKRVRFRYTAPILLERFAPPLAHRKITQEGDADLIVDVWDSYTSGIPFQRPYLVQDKKQRVPYLNTDDFSAMYHQLDHGLTILNRRTGHAIWAMLDYRLIKSHVNNHLFQMWSVDQGALLVHSACVSKDDNAILLVGSSGSGKSTTALVCLASGLQFLGEDYCFVHMNSQHPCAESLDNTAKLTEWSAKHLPELLAHTRFPADAENEKTILSLYPAFQNQIIPTSQLSAIVIPQITHQPNTAWKPASSALALKTMAPSTIYQMSETSHQFHFKAMVRLARQLPAYELLLGTDINQVAPAIASLIENTRKTHE